MQKIDTSHSAALATEGDPDTTFRTAYLRVLRAHGTGVCSIDEESLDTFAKELEEAQRIANTGNYIVMAITCMVCLVVYPVIIHSGYSLVIETQSRVTGSLVQTGFLNSHYGVLIGSSLFLIVVPIYTLLMPHFPILPVLSKFSGLASLGRVLHRISDIKKKSLGYLGFAALTNYIWFAVALMYLLSYARIPESVTRWATVAWMMAPIALLGVAPMILLFHLSSRITGPRAASCRAAAGGYSQCLVAYHLLLVMDNLDRSDWRPSSKRDIDRVISSMTSVSLLMRAMCAIKGIRATHRVNGMKHVQLFESLKDHVKFPVPGSSKIVRDHLYHYTNAFLGGSHGTLFVESKDDCITIEERRGLDRLRRVFRPLILTGYFLLPLIALPHIERILGLGGPPLNLGILCVAVAAWPRFVRVLFPGMIAPETDERFTNIITTVLRSVFR